VGLGLFLWVFLLSVGVTGATAFLLGLVVGLAIFFYVLLYGGEHYRR
jgi:hypothetical protein